MRSAGCRFEMDVVRVGGRDIGGIKGYGSNERIDVLRKASPTSMTRCVRAAVLHVRQELRLWMVCF